MLLGGPGGLTYGHAYLHSEVKGVGVGNLSGNGPRDLVMQSPTLGYYLLESDLGCLGSITTYGAGCPGTGGLVPALTASGCPAPGGNYALEVTNGPPSTIAFASFGLGQGSFTLPNGCDLLLNPWIPVFVGFNLDASGEGSLGIAVSPTALLGVTSTAQVGLFDPGAQDFYTLTNGVAITVR